MKKILVLMMACLFLISASLLIDSAQEAEAAAVIDGQTVTFSYTISLSRANEIWEDHKEDWNGRWTSYVSNPAICPEWETNLSSCETVTNKKNWLDKQVIWLMTEPGKSNDAQEAAEVAREAALSNADVTFG